MHRLSRVTTAGSSVVTLDACLFRTCRGIRSRLSAFASRKVARAHICSGNQTSAPDERLHEPRSAVIKRRNTPSPRTVPRWKALTRFADRPGVTPFGGYSPKRLGRCPHAGSYYNATALPAFPEMNSVKHRCPRGSRTSRRGYAWRLPSIGLPRSEQRRLPVTGLPWLPLESQRRRRWFVLVSAHFGGERQEAVSPAELARPEQVAATSVVPNRKGYHRTQRYMA